MVGVDNNVDAEFPYSLSAPTSSLSSRLPPLTCPRVISVPLPTHRLASAALRALQVDAELSPLVQRSFLLSPPTSSSQVIAANGHALVGGSTQPDNGDEQRDERKTVLRTEYKATTNRMLRVAVNGFMESLGVVLGVMEELDVDVLDESGR